MPMTFDQYNLCSYKCQYCFSFYQRIHSSKDYAENHIRWVNVDKVKKIFLEPDSSQFGEYVKARIPLQWGGLSEPFDLLEPHLGVGLKLMKFFREIDYPVAFSTKSVWFIRDKRYIDVLKGAKNFHFKWSIITLDIEKARLIEQGVPTPQERLEAMGEVAKWGTAGVNLRLRPFLLGVSNPTHLNLIRESAKRGIQAVTTEFFCLESRADLKVKKRYVILSKACGFDIWQFYRKYTKGSGYRRLNYEVKRPFIEEMQELCKELHIGFFVSDAHHKEKCALADGCRWGSCCGLPNDKYFSNYAKCQFTEAITIAKEKGEVRFSDITKNEHRYLKQVMWKEAQGLNQGTSEARLKNWNRTLFDLMRFIWNNPKRANSPWRYFDKMMIPTSVDEDGNVIYSFNSKKYENRAK